MPPRPKPFSPGRPAAIMASPWTSERRDDMIEGLASRWWAVLLRGLFAILFGICAIAWPGLTLTWLALLFGAYCLVDGLFAIVAAITAPAGAPRWMILLLEGIVSVIIGVLTFIWPGLTALVLLYFIATWAIITGILEIVTAIRLRKVISNEWLLILSGVLSIGFGVLLFARPLSGALAVVWLIGIYAIIFGVMLIGLSLRLRGWHSSQTPATA
jgi:uncharacterized membrane protein HdeD (DUF308 family)